MYISFIILVYFCPEFQKSVSLFSGLNSLGDGVTPGQGVAIEFLLTFVLVFTVFATCDKSRKDLAGSGPLAIGLAVAMCHLGFVSLLSLFWIKLSVEVKILALCLITHKHFKSPQT